MAKISKQNKDGLTKLRKRLGLDSKSALNLALLIRVVSAVGNFSFKARMFACRVILLSASATKDGTGFA